MVEVLAITVFSRCIFVTYCTTCDALVIGRKGRYGWFDQKTAISAGRNHLEYDHITGTVHSKKGFEFTRTRKVVTLI